MASRSRLTRCRVSGVSVRPRPRLPSDGMDQEAPRTVRRDLARPVALALNVVFAVLLTALTMLLLVVGAVGLVGQNESVAQSDLAGIAYAAAVLAGVIGLALLPAVFLLVTGIGRYIRRESGRLLRAADFGLVAA